MHKKYTYLYLILIILLSLSGITTADIKKDISGIVPVQTLPEIWVRHMSPFSTSLKKGSVVSIKFKVFKNYKVNNLKWKIDLKVNDNLNRSIRADKLKFIPIRGKGGDSYCEVFLHYKILDYGKYNFSCTADSENIIRERNEGNNRGNIWMEVKSPVIPSPNTQIIATDIVLFGEKATIGTAYQANGYVEGSHMGLTCSWKRTGKEPPVDFDISLFIDGKKKGGQFCPKNLQFGKYSYGWEATPGDHEVRFQIEKNYGDFPELNERNNQKTVKFHIDAK